MGGGSPRAGQDAQGVFGTAKHYFGGFERLFKGMSDPRDADWITYPLAGFLFTGVWMFACQLGSRRQIQAKLRGNSRSEAKFEALFGVESIPHGDSLNYGFKRWNQRKCKKPYVA